VAVEEQGYSIESGFEVSPVESAEAPQEHEQAAEAAPPGEMDDEKFSSAAMWSEEETRFTPIDIEAVAVSEPAPPEPVAVEAAPQETGFEFQPVVEEQTAPEPEPAEPPQPASEEADVAAAELSPALIDEIVRRVVAQMSDRVVREVAWEVVPDTVERIIKEMTRDSLSNKKD
ncbi:MAG TPA: hypothetical protein VNO14_05690, partial [Blastocatellia bacterium]|nr:hypothetical protein [Blastocatellia bacterium]